MNEQTTQLRRVRQAIATHVVAFITEREGCEFYNKDLHDFVNERVPIAPGSSDRVMRDLRTRGVIRYELVSRRQSLYRVLPREQGRLFK